MSNAEMTAFKNVRSLKTKHNKLRKRGVTMVELAAVIGVAAIFVLGALALYNIVNQSRLFNQASSDLNMVQQQVRSIYSGQSSYTGIAPTALIVTKALPQKMVFGTTELRHSFSGRIGLRPADAGSGANSGFEVTFEKIPQEACAKFLLADLGRTLYSAGASTTRDQEQGLPFDPTQAAESCNSSYNDIKWVFN